MPHDSTIQTTVTGFNNVPDFAKGQVRDLRVRWALEEIDKSYRMELMDAFVPRPSGYYARQPFGQVPAFNDGEIELFETGSILLYLGEQDERLLPQDPQARWTATTWLFAGLNSVEPAIMQHVWLDLFHADKDWSKPAATAAAAFRDQRLERLADALGEREWLAGSFSVADIMMVTILRELTPEHLAAMSSNLANYRERGEARPAFQKALAGQMADFIPDTAKGEVA